MRDEIVHIQSTDGLSKDLHIFQIKLSFEMEL